MADTDYLAARLLDATNALHTAASAAHALAAATGPSDPALRQLYAIATDASTYAHDVRHLAAELVTLT
jgi:hypothetical protein